MSPTPDDLEILKIVPAMITLAGVLIAAGCWPLANGKIAPNRFYGIRTKLAFSSDEAWYRVNKFGGEVFFNTGILITFVGLVGLFLPYAFMTGYSLAAAIIVLVSVVVSGIIVLLGAR